MIDQIRVFGEHQKRSIARPVVVLGQLVLARQVESMDAGVQQADEIG